MADRELLQAALSARQMAHAPYSGYAVGAALRDEKGAIHAGCNVENVSYGLTVCAERAAISRMVADGGHQIREVVVVTADGGAPCGACRQVLLEFAEDPAAVKVYAVDEAGAEHEFTLSDLIPYGFRSIHVNRTKPI